MSKKNYEELYNNFMNYEKQVHAQNQKRITTGLKINIIFPLFFLVLCFITDASKLIFLILWILSLFGIAFYLMYVEYQDYKLQERMKNLAGEEFGDGDSDEPEKLIGSTVENVEQSMTQKMDNLEERVDEKMEKIREKMIEKKELFQEKKQEKREANVQAALEKEEHHA